MTMSIDYALKYCYDFHQFILSQLAGVRYEETPRALLALAYAAITLEHQYAILTLSRSNIRGSALALLRPQVETAFRGLWAMKCATDDQVEAIGQGGTELFPRFRETAKILDAAYGYQEYPYFRGIAQEWRGLCGLTHSGLEQLSRRFRDDGSVGPNYPDEQIAGLLHFSPSVTAALFVPVFVLIGYQDKATDLENWAVQR
ncbi:MAG TPA: hypothetical protein VGG56_12785 [Terracidiphilus sp.]|jgi:hypothetical protein